MGLGYREGLARGTVPNFALHKAKTRKRDNNDKHRCKIQTEQVCSLRNLL